MSHKAIAFVATCNGEAALRFYQDVLQLTLIEESPFAIVFDAFGTMLRVQKAEQVSPAPYTVFGLEVTNIEEEVRSLKSRDVSPVLYPQFEQDALGIWTAPGGTKVFWFKDPDGNLLSLSQF